MKMKTMITRLGTFLLLASWCTAVQAAGGATPPPKLDWSFKGPFGVFDRAQLKRGWQVYNEVCSGCHSINQIYYRHLEQIGYSSEEVKKLAAGAEIPAGPNEDGETHEDGEVIVRAGKPFDKIKMPFQNDAAARAANNGALPPDLSLTTKAHPAGVDYISAVLTGYKDPPSGYKMNEGMYYNAFYAGKQIAMPNPLSDGAVEYVDGTKASVQQMAVDVSAFLAWAAEPEMEDRKRLGIKIILFLIVLTSLLYALKRRIWSDVH